MTDTVPSADGVVMVRASGASAALAAVLAEPERRTGEIQLAVRAALPRGLPPSARRLAVPGCAVEVMPPNPGERSGVVLVTVDAHRLSIDATELRPLLFQQVPVPQPLAELIGSSVGHLLAANTRREVLDEHGVTHFVVGLVELVLRSALRDALNRADSAKARYRDAIEYINRHLADPELSAERIADALFISRRRLYQLFNDGDGISGRIRRMRIERAKQLLADPTRASSGVGELVRQCGFVNSAHFSRTFRAIVGSTPKEYRASVAEIDRGHQLPEDG